MHIPIFLSLALTALCAPSTPLVERRMTIGIEMTCNIHPCAACSMLPSTQSANVTDDAYTGHHTWSTTTSQSTAPALQEPTSTFSVFPSASASVTSPSSSLEPLNVSTRVGPKDASAGVDDFTSRLRRTSRRFITPDGMLDSAHGVVDDAGTVARRDAVSVDGMQCDLKILCDLCQSLLS